MTAIQKLQPGIIAEHQIIPFGLDGKRSGLHLIKRALPPVGQIMQGIFQTFGMQMPCPERKDADLRAAWSLEASVVMTRDEHSIIGIHTHVKTASKIFGQQGDIA